MQETIKEIPTTNPCIWCADANGKLGNRDREGVELTKIIGMCTFSRTTEPGHGKHLQKICAQRELIPMKTWRRQPRQTRNGNTEISTWVRSYWGNKRQIDYVMVIQNFRRCVRGAHVIHGWRGNREQRRNLAVKLEICPR